MKLFKIMFETEVNSNLTSDQILQALDIAWDNYTEDNSFLFGYLVRTRLSLVSEDDLTDSN